MSDFLPVMTTRHPELFAWKFYTQTPEGWEKGPPPRVKTWDWQALPVDGLDSLERALRWLEPRPRSIVIRGDMRPHVDRTRKVGRTLEGPEAFVQDTPRRWLMIDIDGFPGPDWWPGPGVHLEADRAIVNWMIQTHLPECFHPAAVLAHFSAGAGLDVVSKGDVKRYRTGRGLVKLHLWFWLSQPATSEQLKAWSVFRALEKPYVDPAMFNANQIHFTARPGFLDADGRQLPDPLEGKRWIRLDGEPDVWFGGELRALELHQADLERARQADMAAAAQRRSERRRLGFRENYSRRVAWGLGALRGMRTDLAQCSDGQAYHAATYRAAQRLAAMAFDGTFGIDESDLDDLIDYVIAAGKSPRGARRAIAWAMDHPATRTIEDLLTRWELEESQETHLRRARRRQPRRRPVDRSEALATDPRARQGLADVLRLPIRDGFAEGAPCPSCRAHEVGFPIDPEMQREGTCVACGWRGPLVQLLGVDAA